MGLIYHAPKWELIGIIVLYFGGGILLGHTVYVVSNLTG
eukprot:COSAG01_NODE_34440_length_547_cov_2.167411_1_plen_39_part_10